MNNKRILSVGLAAIMMISSTSVFAARGDYYKIPEYENAKYKERDVLRDRLALRDVMRNQEEFVYEGLNGKAYTISAAREAYRNVDGESTKFYEELKKEEGIKVGVEKEDKLEVVEVSAINATQMEVKFSAAVDKAAVELVSSNLFTLGSANPSDIKLSKDGKTATLTFTNASDVEVTSKVFVVEPVKVDKDTNTKKYTEIFTYKDTVKPEVTKVEALTSGAKATTATVTFSEPISAVAAVKVNGKALTVTTDYVLGSKATTLVLNNLELDATKSHTLEVLQLADGATVTNTTAYISKTFNVTVDKTAPTLLGVEMITDKGLKLIFSKPVVLATPANNKAEEVIKIVDKVAVVDKTSDLFTANTQVVSAVDATNKEYKVEFSAGKLATLLGTKSEVKLTLQMLKDVFVDTAGNKIAASETEITLKADKVKPQILSVDAKKDKDGKVESLVFKLDEAVSATGKTAIEDIFESTVLNTETLVQVALTDLITTGATTVTETVSADGKTITVDITTPKAASGKYEFEVKPNVFNDKAATPNGNKATKVAVDFGKATAVETYLTAPTATTVPDNKNVITVTYTEAVKVGAGKGSAVDTSSYKLNGAALPAGTTFSINAAQKVVIITLPAGSFATTDTAAAFVISKDVESKDDAKIKLKEDVLKVITVTDNVKPELTAELNADGTMTLTTSEAFPTTDKVVAANTTAFLAGDLKLSFTGINLDNAVAVGNHNVVVEKQTAGPLKGKYILTVTENAVQVDLNTVAKLKLETKATTQSADAALNLLKEEAVLIEK